MKRLSLRQRAYEAIKDMIINYELKPSARLSFHELSQRLKMSQTPIREALSKLEQEHYVRLVPKKGYVVRQLDLQEVTDLYELRMALESLAVELAAKRMDETHKRRLSLILDNYMDRLKTEKKDKILELEEAFHVIIMEASGNRLLLDLMNGLLGRIRMLRKIDILTSNRLIISHQEHLKIYHALIQGDAEKAVSVMRMHILNAKENVIQRLQDGSDILSMLI